MVALCILSHIGSGAAEAPNTGSAADVDGAMLEWLEQHGTTHSTVIRTPPGGERAVFATRDIEGGGVIARIPMKLSVMLEGSLDPDDYGWLKLAASLAADAADGASFHQPYYKAMPMLQSHLHTMHYVTFPPEYFPLLKSKPLEEMITEAQNDLNHYWEQNGDELSRKGVTIEGLKAACVTMATRMLMFDQQVVLHPLLDFANHWTNCTNDVEYKSCDGDGQGSDGAEDSGRPDGGDEGTELGLKGQCLYWTAGDSIKEGEEVCFHYDIRTPDQCFLEYGFILPDDPPGMSSIDGATFNWGQPPPSRVGGQLSAMRKELKRLEKRIKTLEGLGKQEAAMQVAPTDPGGGVLEGLKRLRQQRLTALGSEVKRLQESIEITEALIKSKAAAADGEGQSKEEL